MCLPENFLPLKLPFLGEPYEKETKLLQEISMASEDALYELTSGRCGYVAHLYTLAGIRVNVRTHTSHTHHPFTNIVLLPVLIYFFTHGR